MSKWSVKDTIELLRLNVDAEIEANKAKERAKTNRQMTESSVWHNYQALNPNLGRPIEELKLGENATKGVPEDAKTFGDLCQHSAKELSLKIKKIYVNEIRDSLRYPFGLVLKPDQ